MNFGLIRYFFLLVAMIILETPALVAYTLDEDIDRLRNSESPKVLCLDGGGMRGVFSLKILEIIDEQLPDHLSSYVDYFGGSSTGSIVATGLSIGITLKEAQNFYWEEGPKIFSSGILKRLCNVFKEATYDDEPLNHALRKAYGPYTTLGDVTRGLVISALGIHDGMQSFAEPVVFDSRKVRDHAIPLWQIPRASSGAPGILKPFTLNGITYIDGGMVANNPSLMTILQVIEPYHCDVSLQKKFLSTCKVLSIGTGYFADTFHPEKAKLLGSLYWLKSLPHTIIHATMNLTDLHMTQLLGERYLRLNAPLPEYLPLDGAAPSQLKKAEEAALKYVYKDGGLKEIIDAAKLLKA